MPATVVTLPLIPATVVTLPLIPATVWIASVFSVPSSMSASVAMSSVIDASVATSSLDAPASGLPVVSLKARYLPLRVSFAGSVMSIEVGSVTGALMARSFASETCWIMMIWLSSCSLRAAALRSPAVTKSVVRSMSRAPVMVIVSDPVAALTRVTDPVPAAPIETV